MLAVVLAIPVLTLIVRLSVFLASLKAAVESAVATVKANTARIDSLEECSGDHETRIQLLEERHPPPSLTRRAGDLV